MLIEFQQVPTFTEGQLLAAADLNTFNQNNTMIKKLFAAPQPLFMDSHAYAPKVLPLYWRSPDFTIWEGSFIYREGMRYAYLGFHVKLDGPETSNGFEYPISKFGDATDSVNIAIITKYTEFSYRNIYSAPSTYSNYFASMPLYQETTTPVTKKSIYQFTIRDGSGNNTDVNGAGYLTKNARISQIRIDLEPLNLQDGELVPIKLMLLVNEDPRKSNRADTARFKGLYENFSNYFILRKTDPITPDSARLDGIFYSHLYAYTDGDLSYTDNWPSVSGVVTTGSGVLLTSNMQKLSGKQRYITDRLKNRPMPLTGAILYLSAYGGTSSVKYPQYDVVPGEWEYSKEEYALSISNDLDEFSGLADGVLKIVQGAGRVNLHSNLATFAWNPAFELYNQPTLSFKFFGNTAARQVLIVDFTEAPVSQTSTRSNWLPKGNSTARSGHLFGYFDGAGNSGHTGYYGSVYAAHDMTQYVNSPGSKKVYKNHLFQVRIPSPNTVVYSPETNTFTGSNGFFLTRGFWEDQVSITFSNETKGALEWGLFKSGGGTLQFGFVGDIATSTVEAQYTTPEVAPNEFEKQYVRNTNYNNADWNWYMSGGTKGHSQIFVNLYDHSNVHYRAKANYISYCFLIGFDDYKASDNVITTPPLYTGGSTLTYSSVVSAISTINSSLNESYDQLFVNNPHFQYYNMFWGAPKSTLNLRNIYKDYNDKFLFFTRQRTGNILIVRGKNVTMYYGEISKLKRDGSPYGSLHKVDDVDVEFEYSDSLISGDSEQTKVVHLSSIEKLAYNQRYYIQGETITYAAEFFEEPS